MRNHTTLLTLIPAALVISACGREAARPDDALRNDLTLASQATVPAQYMSPGEMGYANSPYSPYGTTPYAGQPAPQRIPAPAARPTSSVRRTSSASRPSSSGTIYRAPAPAPEPQIIKHTKRDAAIGAAAGAIIGAATSRDKVKGGLIGAAIGGVLGGVIGNNVDVQRKY
jgi:hypothetical protein